MISQNLLKDFVKNPDHYILTQNGLKNKILLRKKIPLGVSSYWLEAMSTPGELPPILNWKYYEFNRKRKV